MTEPADTPDPIDADGDLGDLGDVLPVAPAARSTRRRPVSEPGANARSGGGVLDLFDPDDDASISWPSLPERRAERDRIAAKTARGARWLHVEELDRLELAPLDVAERLAIALLRLPSRLPDEDDGLGFQL